MDSINTNEMMHDKPKQEPKTWVWWDINSCPVPDGYDARLVRHSIESVLNKEGYSGPLTITAVGQLNHTLNRAPHVLPAISSTGILLSHVVHGFVVFDQVMGWTWENPPPGTLMLITNKVKEVKHLSRHLLRLERRYTILQAYPQSLNFKESSLVGSKNFIWETLLKDSEETSRHALDEKICEIGESPGRFFCELCSFVGQSFEDFTTHLKSRDHLMDEVCMAVGPSVKKLVKRTFNVSRYINNYKKKTLKDSIEEDRMSL